MSKGHTVRVADGKYTFINRGLTIAIERHGKPWHEQQAAFNALTSIMYELDAARVVLEAARRLGDAAPPGIKRALSKHAALVGDLESPSRWTVSE